MASYAGLHDNGDTAARVIRFWSFVFPEPNTGCLLWSGNALPQGYGLFYVGLPTRARAHRFAYELVHGPIPAGMVVCHRCDTPACVNVDHLYIGTVGDNNRDAFAKGRNQRVELPARWAATGRCARSHDITDPANVGHDKHGRHCVACRRQRRRGWRKDVQRPD